MNIKTITYQRVKNLGNYESERLEMTAELNEGDDYQTAIAALKQKVKDGLEIEQPPKKPDFDDNPF